MENWLAFCGILLNTFFTLLSKTLDAEKLDACSVCAEGAWWPETRCCYAAGFPDVQYVAPAKHWNTKEKIDYPKIQGNLNPAAAEE